MGRKRKYGVARYADGKPVQERPRPHLQRVQDFARMMRDPTLGTPLGLLYAQGKIDQGQYEAGCAYREAMHAWCVAMGLPRRTPKAMMFEVYVGRMGDADTVLNEADAKWRERCQKTIDRYNTAVGINSLELSCVQATCVDDLNPVGHEHLLALVCGLTRLAAWRKGGR